MKEKYEPGEIHYNCIILNVLKNGSCMIKQLSKNKIIRKLQILFYNKKIKQGLYKEKNTFKFISKHNFGIIIKKSNHQKIYESKTNSNSI